ncbi:acetyl-CoA synthetase [Tamaricihabitans halophyticus]|uniref:acetate--CoA ligase n=1 Tax=Tamaricihabitans halophyticus TaxID=1262583 RepID=A0A4R2QYJ3_9PSEU|nr:AMP-binding protein [Tamaricihabitans halophyticus]TCP55332.1 acetyl-CoA synthetase [Tamaricihabitans halophyticus]
MGDPAVWFPDDDVLARSRLGEFLRTTGCTDLAELDGAARTDPAWFWDAAASWLALDWQQEPERIVRELDAGPGTRWFPGGALNIADNAVDRWLRRGRAAEPALSWENEDGTSGCLSFAELAAEIDRVAAGLLDNGIGFGDRVGIQLPMVREAVVAMLACAKIGAIAVLLFSGFGESAVQQRLNACEAVAVISADGFARKGRIVELRGMLARVAEQVPSLRTIVLVGLGGPAQPKLAGEVDWASLGSTGRAVPSARCPSDHPLMIAYTSGTTGAPKGIMLGHAGFAIKAGTDAAWCFDIGVGDMSSWITDPGWIMSPITVLGGLVAGSAVAVYGGAVDYPDTGRVWRFARDAGVTMLGVSPTLVRTLAKGGPEAVPDDLGALRVFASSGEPWTPDAFEWLFDTVGGKRLPIINYSGGTEVSGAILSNTTMQPIVSCGFAGSVPGMAADVADEGGDSLRGAVGELVLRASSPGMPLGFWGDTARYAKTYWSSWPGVWLHGDFAEVDSAGVWYIRGRSDDTMNVAGKRIGPAEIEQVVGAHTEVSECAAFGVPDPIKGEAVVVVVVANTASPVTELAGRIAGMVRERLGAALAPRAVHIVAELPRTRSGKILRRVIRAVYLGDQPGDLSSLDNPEAIDMVAGLR